MMPAPPPSRTFRWIATALIAWAATGHSPAQTYINTEWVQSIGSPDVMIPWTASTMDAAGNLIVVGNTEASPGHTDVLVTKYNSAGDLLWQQTYNGTADGDDHGIVVEATAGGDIFVAATVTITGNEQDFAVLKYDAAGTLQWAATWNGPTGLADVPSDMAIDNAGNVFVCGATLTGPALTDYALVKFNASGTFQWAQTYDHIGLIDAATSVKLDGSGHPIITGGSASAVNSWDYATLRYNGATGAGMDTVRVALPGVGLDQPLGMSMDEAGNIYVTGYRTNGGQKDIQTLKFAHDLELAWVVDHDGTGHDDAGQAVAADASGNVYVAGYVGNQYGGSDFITIKYSAAGAQQWLQRHRVHSTSWKAQATKIAVSGNRIVVTGSAVRSGSLDYATVCYNGAGDVQWSKTHDAAGDDDLALALAVGNNGVYYVSGITEGPNGPAYTTVKYDVYHHGPDAVTDSLGNPLYFDDEVIVKVRGHLVDTTFVDRPQMQHTTLDRLVPDSVADALAGAFGVAATRVKVMKVFRRWTRADSISISRLGDEVRLPEYWSVFKMSAKAMDPLAVADSVQAHTYLVQYAQINAIARAYANDPVYAGEFQASLAPTTAYPNAHINIEPAWDIQTGRPDIRVGVIDLPIEWDHEDFMHNGISKVVDAYDYHREQPGEGPQPDLTQPYEVSYTAWDALTHAYHGTSCAGIIGALRNNHTGMAGIAGGDVDGDGNTGVGLVSLIVGDGDGGGYMGQDGVAVAIVEGSSVFPNNPNGFGCHVLNLSIGFPGIIHQYPDSIALPQPLLVEAVRTGHANACVLAGAMGNHHIPPSGTGNFASSPTSFPFTGLTSDYAILSIGGTGNNGDYLTYGNGMWFYANYGVGIDLAAPGSRDMVVSSASSNSLGCDPVMDEEEFYEGYNCFQGTSASAPHVAGVAALMVTHHSTVNGAPNPLAPDDVEHILEQTATDIYSTGYDDHTGHGRLNAGAALAMVNDPYCVIHPVVHPQVLNQIQMPPVSVWIDEHHPWGIPAGTYSGYRVILVHQYDVPIDPEAEVLGVWGLEGEIRGTDHVPSGLPWASFSYVMNGNTVVVMAETNVWYLEDVEVNGQTVSTFFPVSPNNVYARFSIHLMDPYCWGGSTVQVEEVTVAGDILLFPNPTTGDLQLDFGPLTGPGWNLEIVDALGRVAHIAPNINATQQRYILPTHSLAQGSYALRLQRNGESHVKRFIKQ